MEEEDKFEDEAGPAAPPPQQKSFAETFNLQQALKSLEGDSPDVHTALERAENELTNIRQAIQRESRKNFVLERSLSEIDEKIKLLVKNRISAEEVQKAMSGDKDEKEQAMSPLQGKREDYEELFYILQSKPRYFAKLARLVNTNESPMFVQTVVFDMYGDQYDTREERLLLDLFKKMVQAELQAATSKGTLLRNNTATTQMLSAYARRGQGLSILKDILEAPLKEMTGTKDLNLEIDPVKVYQQMITDTETKTGKQSDLPREVDAETALKHPEVEPILNKRIADLTHWCSVVLASIVKAVDAIPYGVRWICKQLAVLCRERFADADRNQVGSLIGGYVYLRYFNPVIVNPDGNNII